MTNDRIFGVMPNYLTVNGDEQYKPLTVKEKFKITAAGAFDYYEFGLVAVLAGIAQAENNDSVWGQGWGAYGKRYAASFGDQMFGNMFVGAVYPSILRHDPRYFRRGRGGFFRRSGYAISRVFVTQRDAGGQTCNYSEFLGNASAAALSNVYHPASERSFGDTADTFGVQLAIDAFGNQLKEFWPDIKHKVFRR